MILIKQNLFLIILILITFNSVFFIPLVNLLKSIILLPFSSIILNYLARDNTVIGP